MNTSESKLIKADGLNNMICILIMNNNVNSNKLMLLLKYNLTYITRFLPDKFGNLLIFTIISY